MPQERSGSGAAAAFALHLAIAYARHIARVSDALAKMVLTPQSFPPLNLPGAGGVASVTSNDVARGFMLESVLTNRFYSYAMPTNATGAPITPII